jgi:hypothetical protein
MVSSTAALTLKKLPVVGRLPVVSGASNELPPRSVKMRTVGTRGVKVRAVLWHAPAPPPVPG